MMMKRRGSSGNSSLPAARSSIQKPAGSIPGASVMRRVSNGALLSSIKKLSKKEHAMLMNVLLHIAEFDRRRLYLPEGYSSMFEFCMKALDYPRATAGKRIAVARCMLKYPQLYQTLSSGRVSFTNVALITRVITEQNACDLISWIEGRSKREVEELVSRFDPKSGIKERIRPVCKRTALPIHSTSESASPGDLILEARDLSKRPEKSEKRQETSLPGETGKTICRAVTGGIEGDSNGENRAVDTGRTGDASESASNSVEPEGNESMLLEQLFEIRFGAGNPFLRKLEEVRSLLSTKYHRKLELGELFGIMMDEYIKRHSPWERQKRREKRAKKKLEKERQK